MNTKCTNKWIEIFTGLNIEKLYVLLPEPLKKPTISKLNLRRKWTKFEFQDMHMWFYTIEIGPENFFFAIWIFRSAVIADGHQATTVDAQTFIMDGYRFCLCLLFSGEKSFVTIFCWLKIRTHRMHFMPIREMITFGTCLEMHDIQCIGFGMDANEKNMTQQQ